MSARSRSMSSSNALSVCPLACCMFLLRSAVAAGNIVLSARFARIGEDFRRFAIFDKLAEVEEGGALRDTRRLLHIVSHDRDRIAAAKLVNQLLDLGGGDRVERRTGLVHQNDLRVDRDRAGDAQALLLPARQSGAAFLEPVLDLVPQPGAARRRSDEFV